MILIDFNFYLTDHLIAYLTAKAHFVRTWKAVGDSGPRIHPVFHLLRRRTRRSVIHPDGPPDVKKL